MVTNPYSATAITDPKPVGTLSNYPLKSTDDSLVVIPLSFGISAGSINFIQVTDRCFLEDLGGNVYRLHHPRFSPEEGSIFLSTDATASMSYDYSNAATGYTDITLGAAVSSSFQGYLAYRTSKYTGSFENGAIVDSDVRSIHGQGLRPAFGAVQSLSVAWISIDLDASGDPLPDTAEGSIRFNVEHSDVGEYTVTLGASLPDGWVFMVENEDQPALPLLLAPGSNTVIITMLADPGAGALKLAMLGPTDSVGVAHSVKVNTIAPNSARGIFYPMFGTMRDGVIAPFRFETDGTGLITATSLVPAGMVVKKNGTAMEAVCGRSVSELVCPLLKKDTNNTRYSADKSELSDKGKCQYTFGGAEASASFSGCIIGSSNSVR